MQLSSDKVLYSYPESELEMILAGKDLLNDPKLEHESQPQVLIIFALFFKGIDS